MSKKQKLTTENVFGHHIGNTYWTSLDIYNNFSLRAWTPDPIDEEPELDEDGDYYITLIHIFDMI